MKACCHVCQKEFKKTDWVKMDNSYRLAHCTCIKIKVGLQDIDTFNNILNKYSYSRLKIAN